MVDVYVGFFVNLRLFEPLLGHSRRQFANHALPNVSLTAEMDAWGRDDESAGVFDLDARSQVAEPGDAFGDAQVDVQPAAARFHNPIARQESKLGFERGQCLDSAVTEINVYDGQPAAGGDADVGVRSEPPPVNPPFADCGLCRPLVDCRMLARIPARNTLAAAALAIFANGVAGQDAEAEIGVGERKF
jgi:hypothetical protein